jgi:hypothetical protein
MITLKIFDEPFRGHLLSVHSILSPILHATNFLSGTRSFDEVKVSRGSSEFTKDRRT